MYYLFSHELNYTVLQGKSTRAFKFEVGLKKHGESCGPQLTARYAGSVEINQKLFVLTS